MGIFAYCHKLLFFLILILGMWFSQSVLVVRWIWQVLQPGFVVCVVLALLPTTSFLSHAKFPLPMLTPLPPISRTSSSAHCPAWSWPRCLLQVAHQKTCRNGSTELSRKQQINRVPVLISGDLIAFQVIYGKSEDHKSVSDFFKILMCDAHTWIVAAVLVCHAKVQISHF